MVDFTVPNIRNCYVYQPNILECWAAVGLTLWRSKHGARGTGNSLDELFRRPGGAQYTQILDYIGELNEELGGGTDLSRLPAAEAAVRTRLPRFRSVPSGLPSSGANAFFTWLGCTSSSLNMIITGEGMKTLIRAKAPIAIFTERPGHLQLIVGFSEGNTPAYPELLLFNPERYLLEMARTRDPGINPANIPDDRVSWNNWINNYCGNLVGAKGWHY